MTPELPTFVATRRQLHGIAENFIAGPQYRAAGTIRLAVRPDGFTGTALPVAVHGSSLVWPQGSVPLAGPVSAVVQASGLDVGPPPAEVYHATAPLDPTSSLDIDPGSAELLYRSLYAGGFAIKAVVPEGHPVLWPEHLDVAVTDNEVNYGVSAGDDFHALPYAYVGPWDHGTAGRAGSIWNAPFGALHALDAAADVDAISADVIDFFRRAQSQL